MRVYTGNRMIGRLMCCLLFVLVSFFCVSCGKSDSSGEPVPATPVPTETQGFPVPTIEADVQEVMLQGIYFHRMEIGPKEETDFTLRRRDGSILRASMVSYAVNGEFALYSLDLFDESGNEVYRFYTEERGDTSLFYEVQGGKTVLAGARTDMVCPWLDPANEAYYPDNSPQNRVMEILKKRGTVSDVNMVTLTEYTFANGNKDVIAGIAGLHILLKSATGPSGALLSDSAYAAYEEGAVNKQALSTGEPYVYYSTWRGKRYDMYLSGDDVTMKATDGREICTTNGRTARWAGEEPFLTNTQDGTYFRAVPLQDLLAEEDPIQSEISPVTGWFQMESYDEFLRESGLDACMRDSLLSNAVFQYAKGSLSIYWPKEDGIEWRLGDDFLLAGVSNAETVEYLQGPDILFSRDDVYYYFYKSDTYGYVVMNNLVLSVSNDGTDRSRLGVSLGGFPYGYVELSRGESAGFPKRMSCQISRDIVTGQIISEGYYAAGVEIARVDYRYIEVEEGDMYCRVAYGYIGGRSYGKCVQFCKKETPEVIIFSDDYTDPVIRLGEPFSLPSGE